MDVYTLLHLKWMTTRTCCIQRELCSVLCGSLDGRRVWGEMDTCICMAESFCSSPETIKTLLISYTPIQSKKLKLGKRLKKKSLSTQMPFLAGKNSPSHESCCRAGLYPLLLKLKETRYFLYLFWVARRWAQDQANRLLSLQLSVWSN